MTDELKLKLSKVLALIESGATEGEKAAAKKAFARIIERFQLMESDVKALLMKEHYLPYRTVLEVCLIGRIITVLADKSTSDASRGYFRHGKKKVRAVRLSRCSYEDYVMISCAYEYFRRHMATQYAKYVTPELNRCRKRKTRISKKKQLDEIFLSKYFIASGLYREHELVKGVVSGKDLEYHDRMRDIEGGSYKTQLHGNNLLET